MRRLWLWGKLACRRLLYTEHNKKLRGRGIRWIDTRVRRTGRAKGFIGETPQRLLGKDNYSWIRKFGNENILKNKDGIKILDFEGGFEQFIKEVDYCRKKRLDLVLFCACDHNDCHRFVLIKRLKGKRIPGTGVYREYPHSDKTPFMPV